MVDMSNATYQPVTNVEKMADRASLLQRNGIPEIAFSDGSPSSLTPPPEREIKGPAIRDMFSIRGNAVGQFRCTHSLEEPMSIRASITAF